jgi:hypothetical protein
LRGRRAIGRHRDERLQLQEALFPDAFDVHEVLDLLGEDDRLNVYAGELEVRPPGAPTTVLHAARPLLNGWDG